MVNDVCWVRPHPPPCPPPFPSPSLPRPPPPVEKSAPHTSSEYFVFVFRLRSSASPRWVSQPTGGRQLRHKLTRNPRCPPRQTPTRTVQSARAPARWPGRTTPSFRRKSGGSQFTPLPPPSCHHYAHTNQLCAPPLLLSLYDLRCFRVYS